MLELQIREEKPTDYQEVEEVVRLAFEQVDISDQTEHQLVRRMRSSAAYTPDLSLVAIIESKIVGHILLTTIQIVNDGNSYKSLALAPVSVLPEYQNQGIGGSLIMRAHEQARNLGFESIFLIGHENYYPKFGYMKAKDFGVKFPFEVPDENCMCIELVDGALDGVVGIVEYPKEFFE